MVKAITARTAQNNLALFICPLTNAIDDDDEVSTGIGSDRVTVLVISTIAWIEIRSLPLPVLTSP